MKQRNTKFEPFFAVKQR